MDPSLSCEPHTRNARRRRLSQLETEAIERLFDGADFTASAAPDGLLTALPETPGDTIELHDAAASSQGQRSERGAKTATVRWQSVDEASSCQSEQSSGLSMFSLHLARSDLAFSYDVSECLGSGASAEVYRATHLVSDEEVAIKVFMDSKSCTIHAACAEFVCAMRSAGPSALEYKELAFYKSKPALVMELGAQALDCFIRDHFAGPCQTDKRESAAVSSVGSDVSWGSKSTAAVSVSSKAGHLTEDPSQDSQNIWSKLSHTGPTQFDIMSIMHGTLEGLMVMHAAGLAHLDLKPGNIIMTEFAKAKLADFGAACAINSRTGRLLTSGIVRDQQVDMLINTMEHTLSGAVKASDVISPDALPDESTDAVAAAAVAAVQARVLPARSCPGELVVGTNGLDLGRSHSGDLRSREPTILRQTTFVEKAPPAVTFRSESCFGEEASSPPLLRGRTQSVMAAYSRQPAYSLRDVPMQLLCCVQFTCTYSSPERSNHCDQRKVDVWAAGCILYELCTGKPFVKANTERERFVAMAQFYDPGWRPPRLPKIMLCWQPLLDAMMARDPAERLLPAELLSFDVFAGVRGRSRSGVAAEARSLRMSRSMRLVSTTGASPFKACCRLDSRPSGFSDASATRISAFSGEVDAATVQVKRRTLAGGEAKRLMASLSPGNSLMDRLVSGQHSLGSRGRVSV